jgi:hypothetical protein
MTSDLRAVPPRSRRLLALLIAPVGIALLAAGALLAWFAGSPAGHLVGAGVGLIALLLLGVAHGLFWSAVRDEAERRLDETILAAAGPCGSDCGSGSCGVTDCAVKALPRS